MLSAPIHTDLIHCGRKCPLLEPWLAAHRDLQAWHCFFPWGSRDGCSVCRSGWAESTRTQPSCLCSRFPLELAPSQGGRAFSWHLSGSESILGDLCPEPGNAERLQEQLAFHSYQKWDMGGPAWAHRAPLQLGCHSSVLPVVHDTKQARLSFSFFTWKSEDNITS